jgi:hypothetical protein
MGEATVPQPAQQSPPPPPSSEHAWLLEYLRDHDAVCPLCKYNLRGLTQPRCPECGRDVRLTVGLTEPHLRSLIIFLVALSLSAGCGMLSIAILGSQIAERRHLPDFGGSFEDRIVGFLFYGTSLSILPTLFSVFTFRRFLRLPRGAQRLLAVAATLWDLLLLSGLLSLVFGLTR